MNIRKIYDILHYFEWRSYFRNTQFGFVLNWNQNTFSCLQLLHDIRNRYKLRNIDFCRISFSYISKLCRPNHFCLNWLHFQELYIVSWMEQEKPYRHRSAWCWAQTHFQVEIFFPMIRIRHIAHIHHQSSICCFENISIRWIFVLLIFYQLSPQIHFFQTISCASLPLAFR